MRNLTNFINESLKTQNIFPSYSHILPGFNSENKEFGVILTEPITSQDYIKNATKIENDVAKLGFKVDKSLTNHMDDLEESSKYGDWTELEKLKYVLFAPATSNIVYWMTFGKDGEVVIPTSM